MEMSGSSIQTRQAVLSLLYEGKDISADIAPYVLSFSFTDEAHGKADDLQVTLEDRDHRWKKDWYPDKGAKLTASIRCLDWDKPDSAPIVMRCGTFTVDEVELSGAPDTVSIKAVSAAVTTSLRQTKKTKAWENASLKQVAQDMADANGLTLRYDGPDFQFQRMDQRETSDLGFLKRMAEERGMNLKVAEDSIILMSGKDGDSRSPAKTLTRGENAIKSFRFKEKTDGVYGGGSQVNFHNPLTKETTSYAQSGSGRGADVHRVNRRLDPKDDGATLAAAEARAKNKQEVEGSMTILGDPDLRAAMTVNVKGFGRFDGTFTIETATHSFDRGSGYTTDLKLRKALGY